MIDFYKGASRRFEVLLHLRVPRLQHVAIHQVLDRRIDLARCEEAFQLSGDVLSIYESVTVVVPNN